MILTKNVSTAFIQPDIFKYTTVVCNCMLPIEISYLCLIFFNITLNQESNHCLQKSSFSLSNHRVRQMITQTYKILRMTPNSQREVSGFFCHYALVNCNHAPPHIEVQQGLWLGCVLQKCNVFPTRLHLNKVLVGLIGKICFVYIEDVIVYS